MKPRELIKSIFSSDQKSLQQKLNAGVRHDSQPTLTTNIPKTTSSHNTNSHLSDPVYNQQVWTKIKANF